MEIGIENNSDEALKEWTLELEIDQLKSCDGWNGNFKVKGNNSRSRMLITMARSQRAVRPLSAVISELEQSSMLSLQAKRCGVYC